jgi:hypothetical protein
MLGYWLEDDTGASEVSRPFLTLTDTSLGKTVSFSSPVQNTTGSEHFKWKYSDVAVVRAISMLW